MEMNSSVDIDCSSVLASSSDGDEELGDVAW